MEARRVGDYVLTKKLGEGGYSKVYLGHKAGEERRFAVKVMQFTSAKDKEKNLARLRKEFEILQSVEHPNVIRAVELREDVELRANGKKQSVSVMVMECADNGDLFEFLSSESKLELNTCRYYFSKLITVIEFLESKNIAHRDIKAENILLDANFQLKISDFGFSTEFVSGSKNATLLGTKSYCAPEIVKKQQYVAVTADIFSAGVVLFILVFKLFPFQSATLSDAFFNSFVNKNASYWQKFKTVRKDIDQHLVDLFNGMLKENPAERFTLEQIKASQFMQAPIDEQRAIEDIKNCLKNEPI